MTKDELQALGLTDEQVTAIVEDYGKNYVAKTQFNAKNEELKQVKSEMATVQSEIDGLKQQHANNLELSKQIEAMKEASVKREAEYTAKLAQMEVDGIVERSLLSVKAKNAKAVRALLDLEGATAKDGHIKGLDEQLTKLKESDPYLFEVDSVPTGAKPGEPSGTKMHSDITATSFAQMSYLERVKLQEDNPEAYQQLTNGGN